MSVSSIDSSESSSKLPEITQTKVIQPEPTLGPVSNPNIEIADNPNAPDRLKSLGNFLKKVVTTPPALLLKGVEYTALAAFSIASIPALFGHHVGSEVARSLEKPIRKNEKLGFQVGALIASPILVPLAVIGIGAGIGGSTLKALGSGKEDMGVWLKLHIARRAHHLHKNLEDLYGINFEKFGHSLESKVLNDYAKKSVEKDFAISFATFKTKAESLEIRGRDIRAKFFNPEEAHYSEHVESELKSAFRNAKIDSLRKTTQQPLETMDRNLLKTMLKQDLEISADEDAYLEKIVSTILNSEPKV
jgi:hypothetical protein